MRITKATLAKTELPHDVVTASSNEHSEYIEVDANEAAYDVVEAKWGATYAVPIEGKPDRHIQNVMYAVTAPYAAIDLALQYDAATATSATEPGAYAHAVVDSSSASHTELDTTAPSLQDSADQAVEPTLASLCQKGFGEHKSNHMYRDPGEHHASQVSYTEAIEGRHSGEPATGHVEAAGIGGGASTGIVNMDSLATSAYRTLDQKAAYSSPRPQNEWPYDALVTTAAVVGAAYSIPSEGGSVVVYGATAPESDQNEQYLEVGGTPEDDLPTWVPATVVQDVPFVPTADGIYKSGSVAREGFVVHGNMGHQHVLEGAAREDDTAA